MGKLQIPEVGDPIAEGEIRAAKVTFGDQSDDDVSSPTATGVVELVDIDVGAHGNVSVLAVLVEVLTGFVDAGGTSATNVTLTVGDGDDADGFLQSADIAPLSTGVVSSVNSGQPYAVLKDYTADDTIDVTVGGAAPNVQGEAEITVVYTAGID